MKDLNFPKVKNVSAKTIAEDIFPFIPGDKENMKVWDKMFENLTNLIKKDFADKGIPMPKIVIDHSRTPITYGIKTIENEN
jgi:hypothetical protein